TVTWADFKKLFFLQFFPQVEQERLKRDYHSIRQTSSETSTEFMQRFFRLARFLGSAAGIEEEQAKNFSGVYAAAGTEEEQAKNFQWGLHSEESGVTYTDISSLFEELSDIGSPRADDHEHLMLPEMLEDPYVEVALQAPPSPDYVPGPEHADDEIVAEDQPYAEDASPISQSPEYVPESDFEAHPEDDDDEDPEEDPVDYPADGGDDGDDEEESSEDDEEDEMDAPSAEETEPFETDESAATPPPHPAYRMTARISIPALVPMPAWTDSEVVRLIAISSPPASPLSPWSSPPPQHHLLALFLPSASRRDDRPEVTLPPRKREIMRDPDREVGYGITDSSNEIVETLQGAPVSTDMELGGYTERQLLAGQLNMLFRDRRAHAYTCQLMETEARMSREAWMSEIRELQAADRRRQTVISELLRIDHRRSIEISELRTALQGQGLAGDHTQSELPKEAGGKNAHEDDDGQIFSSKRDQETRNGALGAEADKIEKYVRGLPDMIHGSVVASKPKTMQEAIEIATELMDKKVRTFTERETASKRKFENTSRNTQSQQRQQSNKRQNTGRVYTTASGEKKQYGGSKPLCAKCNYHHDGPCAPKCHNCNKIGHLARDCRNMANTNNANNQRGTGSGQKSDVMSVEFKDILEENVPS
nr:hypothetical protein [Tanacetum cinerariifolium]